MDKRIIKKICGLIFFFVSYVPALLLTIIFDGIKATKYFFYDSHQTLKFLLDK